MFLEALSVSLKKGRENVAGNALVFGFPHSY